MVLNLADCYERIGFNEATRNYLVLQGCATTVDLARLPYELTEFIAHVTKGWRPTEALDELEVAVGVGEPVVFPYLALRKLRALRCFLEYRMLRGETLDADLFNEANMDVWLNRVDELKQLIEGDKSASSTMAPFTSFDKWPEWEELFLTYLSHIRGAAGHTPLTYVIRAHETVTAKELQETYVLIDEDLINTICLEGPAYKTDSKRVFDLLKPLLVEGPGWPFIKGLNRLHDGRAAFLCLKVQAEGRSALLTRQAKAFAEIRDAVYLGKGRFTIDQYVAIHQKAHNNLVAVGVVMTETMKVQEFIKGIHDPKLEVAKAVIDGDRTKYDNFEECQQYIKTIITNAKTRGTKTMEQRNVSAVSFEKKPKGNQHKHKKNKGSPPTGGPKPRIHAGTYSWPEYKALSGEEKKQVKALRAARIADKKRQASAMQSDDERQLSSVTSETAGEKDEAVPTSLPAAVVPSMNAGNQFGRKAYKKAKFAEPVAAPKNDE